MEELRILAKKYNISVTKKGQNIRLKPKFNFMDRADIGTVLMFLLPLTLIIIIIYTGEVDITLGIAIGICLLPVIGSIVSVLKSINDVLIIKPNEIEYVNNFRNHSFLIDKNTKFTTDNEQITFRIKYITDKFTIINLFILNENKQYRFFDISSAEKNTVELMKLSNLIIEEIKLRSNTE